MNRAYSLLTVKTVDDDARVITGMASTPTPDRLQDVVEPMGAQFKLPLPLLWQHDSSQPIGHVTHAKVGKSGIEIVAKIAKGVTAEIDRAWALIKAGLVPGLSIGFKAEKGRRNAATGVRRLEKVDLWEISVVTFPLLPEARVAHVKARPFAHRPPTEREFERWLTQDAGLTRSQARAVIRSGFKGLTTQDAAAGHPRDRLVAQIGEATRLLRDSGSRIFR